MVFPAGSLGERTDRTLIDAGPALDAFVLVDDGGPIDRYGTLGTDVRTGAASDAIILADRRHSLHLYVHRMPRI